MSHSLSFDRTDPPQETELVHQLRKVHPDLPRIIITGDADGEAVDGRPDDVMVLSKPFTPATLSEAILKVL